MPFLAAAAPVMGALGGLAGGGASLASAFGAGGGGGGPVAPMDTDWAGFGGKSQAQSDWDARAAKANQTQAELQKAIAEKDSPWNGNEARAILQKYGLNHDDPNLSQKVTELQKKAVSEIGPKPQSGQEARMEHLGGMAEEFKNRETVKADLGDYTGRMGAYDQTSGAADEAIGLTRDAAMGKAPSAAELMMRQGQDQANMAAAGLAASARGGGGNLALAAREAQRQQMMGNQSATNQAGIVRAQEMAQARQAFDQAAMSRRAQALQAAGMSADVAFKVAQQEQMSRNANDAARLQTEGLVQQTGEGAANRGTQMQTGNTAAASASRGQDITGRAHQTQAVGTAVDAAGRAIGGLGAYYNGQSGGGSTTHNAHNGGYWERGKDGNYTIQGGNS